MFNVVVSGGLGDCSQRQKQMCLSQIQLVPFLLNRQERKDTANDNTRLQENTSPQFGPILPSVGYWHVALRVAFGAKAVSFISSKLTDQDLQIVKHSPASPLIC